MIEELIFTVRVDSFRIFNRSCPRRIQFCGLTIESIIFTREGRYLHRLANNVTYYCLPMSDAL